jgi:MazG family protein
VARLVLVDTADELPGLLPLHAWSALMSSDLVVVGAGDHPFLPHVDAAELRHEVVPSEASTKPLTRADLLGGLSPELKGRAEWIVDRARAAGEVVYLFGTADSEAFTRTLGMEAARAGVEVEVVYFGVAPRGLALLRLVRVMERLRGPDGCPWDHEQDHASLARYAVEETYELLEAITRGQPDAIAEELGDVLLQVVFHAQIGADDGTFDIDRVATGIADKLERRHPHVFADTDVAGADEVVANWAELKAAEKPERVGPFDGVPLAQPALELMTAYQRRAAKTGFDWPDDGGALADVRDELEEFATAGTDAEREAELGDLLAAVVGLARRHGVDPELALRGSARRFRARFEAVAAAAGRPLAELTDDQWLSLWAQAKAAEADAT